MPDLRKLYLVPDAPGYTSTDGNEIVATQLDGGLSRYRRDKLNATKSVNATWTLNPTQYQYWRAFFVTAIKKGALPFLCDLLSEDGNGPIEHTCMIVPGSVQMPAQSGLMYQQTCQLEVVPVPHDAATDESIIEIFETSGGDPDAWMNALDHLVTITMPEYIGA